MFSGYLSQSILSRAIKNNLLSVNIHDIRDFTSDKHHITDESSYGGGPGMVLKPEPIVEAVKHINSNSKIIITTPRGKKLDQQMAKELSKEDHIIIICGRYEGIDERVKEILNADEISIGDYILTGGELPAMVLVDSISRHIPGVVKESQSVEEESFSSGLLDWPHYTKPEIFEDIPVPPVLLSGNHGEINRWRRKKSIEKTLLCRPDLLNSINPSKEDMAFIEEIINEKI